MKRLEFLDSLRGLAALYVFVFHLKMMPSLHTGFPVWAETFILYGGSGVYLFFIVSAFCLCLTFPGQASNGEALKVFYTRRLFRIAPLFYAVILLTYARNFLVHGVDVLPPFPDVIANLTFTFNLFPSKQDSLIFAGWTIGVEMMFYIVFPFLYFSLRSIASKIAAYAVAGVAFILLDRLLRLQFPSLESRYLLTTVVHYLPMFIVGMIVFDLYQRLQDRVSWKAGLAFIVAGLLCLIALLCRIVVDLAFMPLFWPSIAYGMLLLGLAFFPIRILVNRVTSFLGQISYSVYLLHGPVILLISRPLYPRIYALPLPDPAKFGLCVAITSPLVLLVSWVAYHLIERPGISFGRRILAAQVLRTSGAAVLPGSRT